MARPAFWSPSKSKVRCRTLALVDIDIGVVRGQDHNSKKNRIEVLIEGQMKMPSASRLAVPIIKLIAIDHQDKLVRKLTDVSRRTVIHHLLVINHCCGAIHVMLAQRNEKSGMFFKAPTISIKVLG